MHVMHARFRLSPPSVEFNFLVVFFFNDTATTEIYTLSLHDALPIYGGRYQPRGHPLARLFLYRREAARDAVDPRSEEHTSELQSQSNLVCRLLLEKKKKTQQRQAPDQKSARDDPLERTERVRRRLPA